MFAVSNDRLPRLMACGALVVVLTVCASLMFPAAAASGSPQQEASGQSFVYTLANADGPNRVAAYNRNTATGELTFLGSYATEGRGTGRSVDSQSPLVRSSDARFLFAVNTASNDISVMSIKQDGSLELIGAPVPSRGVAPASLATHDDLLYVANKGDLATPPNYAGFRIGPTGELTRIRRTVALSPGDNPTQVLFNRSGSRLIGIRFGGKTIDSFEVRSNGKLRSGRLLDNQPGPFAAAFNPAAEDHLLVSDARLPGAVSYRVVEDGNVRPLRAAANSPERAACWIAVHSSGAYFWVANTGTNSLSLYVINPDQTIDLAATHSTLAYGRTPFEISLSPDGRFLYELNIGAGGQSIHALRMTADTATAALEDIGAVALPPGSAPMGLAVVDR